MLARQVVLLTPPKSSHPSQLLSRQQPAPVSPLAATFMSLPASVANKRLTAELSPLDATLTKNTGEGKRLWLSGHYRRAILLLAHPLCLRVFGAAASSILRTLFQVPYPPSPLLATLTKTPGVWGILPILERLFSLSASVPPWQILTQRFFHGRGNDFTHALAQGRHIFLGESLRLDGVMQVDRNFRRPQHPVARPVVLKRSHQAHRHYRNAKLLRHAEPAILKLIHVPVARPFRFRKNNQASAAVNGILRQPPHALQIRRTPHIRNRDVAEALHQPAVRRNFEVRDRKSTRLNSSHSSTSYAVF